MIPPEFEVSGRTRRWWGVLALTGLVAALVIGFFRPASLFGGYLAAFVLVSGLPLGAVSIALMFQLTGGRSGRALTESLRFAAGALALVPLLVIPIYVGIPWLYPWYSNPPAAGGFRGIYLNTQSFVARGAIYLLIWVLLGVVVARTGDPDARYTRKWAGPALVLYLLSLTFAAVDWIGSTAEHWYSTVLGFYFITGQALSALALLVLLAPRRPRMPEPQTVHDWGNLLLTFVVLFAYMAYSQFFIIWNGNLPHEIAFYVPRTRGAWGTVAVVLIVLEFGLPFGALLARDAKRNPLTLAVIAAVVAAARVVDCTWMVLPSLPSGQLLGVLVYLLLIPPLAWFWLSAACWVYPRLRPAAVRWEEARA